MGRARSRGSDVRHARGSDRDRTMSKTKTTAAEKEAIRAKVHEGFRRVALTFPYLTGLVDKIDVRIDERVPTMGIFASGRLAVNPKFAETLTPADLVFVLTHELYYL